MGHFIDLDAVRETTILNVPISVDDVNGLLIAISIATGVPRKTYDSFCEPDLREFDNPDGFCVVDLGGYLTMTWQHLMFLQTHGGISPAQQALLDVVNDLITENDVESLA